MPVNLFHNAGLTLYVMFTDTSDTAVDMTEGTSDKAGYYSVLDAAIDSAGLAAGTYNARILAGTAAAKDPTDIRYGTLYRFVWDGTNETDQITTIVNNLSVATIATVHVRPERTWSFSSTSTSAVSPNIIRLHSSDDNVTLAMDFTNLLNEETDLSAVNTVDDGGGTLTVGNLTLSGDRKKAHFDVTGGMVNGSDYSVEVSVTTIDGDTWTRVGTLQCRDT